MDSRRASLEIILFFLFSTSIIAQESFFEKVEILTDTASYNSLENIVEVNASKRIYFSYTNNQQIVEVRLYPKYTRFSYNISSSRDFEIVDSLLYTGNYYRAKIRFQNLTRSELLRLTIGVESDSAISFEEILLQALTQSSATINIQDNELFIGEEKMLEVFSDNIDNINISGEWRTTENFDYRLSRENNRVFIHIVPQSLGIHEFRAPIRSNKPNLIKQNRLVYTINPIVVNFNVKASRLQFLSLDKSELTYSDITRTEGLEVQRIMVWCRAGLRSDFLSVYTNFFQKPQTFENP